MKISKVRELQVSYVPVRCAPNYFVWSGGCQLFNNFSEHKRLITRYGNQDLDDLTEGNRVGLRLDRNGDLSFLVDERSQGVACRNIVSGNHNLFVVVDHWGNSYETRITRSGK